MTSASASTVETVLRDELVRADRALSGVAPVLGHMLASSGHSLVSDAIVARVRGMLSDLARQLLERAPTNDDSKVGFRIDPVDALADALADDTQVLAHVHAAAMEGHLTQRLESRSAIDPVLTPLWQELIASDNPGIGESAMQALAAQSRFCQTQRRMQYPLSELPPDTLERVLKIWVRMTAVEQEPSVMTALRALKGEYDEAATRAGQLNQVISRMQGAAIAALELEHSGLALFVSALSHLTGQSRDRAVLACHSRQAARLALSLRAAGQDEAGIERQFMVLEPAAMVPPSITDLSIGAARTILQGSQSDTPSEAMA
ncbi:MAG: hypothetical protein WBA51_14395 [Erythrobacter sp.]